MNLTNKVLLAAFAIMPRTHQERAEIRRRLADERVVCELCHIAKCNEEEIKSQVESTGSNIHSLRAYYLANGEWPQSKPIDKSG